MCTPLAKVLRRRQSRVFCEVDILFRNMASAGGKDPRGKNNLDI